MISVKVIADSVSPTGHRLTTFLCTYPRWILAEINTHRMLVKSTSSSRAIPVKKMLERIMNNPALPEYYGRNQAGMQAAGELSAEEQEKVKAIWLRLRDSALAGAEELSAIGLHKQIANRPLETWAYTTTLITGTDWENFFNLRCSKAAQPEFQRLAWLMLKRYVSSVPSQKSPGGWHLPFADKYILDGLTKEQLLKIAVARAARTSYLNMEGDTDPQKDYDLHDRLLIDYHMSPFEHPAECMPDSNRYGCFIGWRPYRKLIAGENQTDCDYQKLLSECPFPEWLEAAG